MLSRVLHTQVPDLLNAASIGLKSYLIDHREQATRVYLLALFIATVVYMLAKPVGSGDTDLWFHMNGGRLFWDFGQLPQSAFYSFFDPQREWVNYYWGFQVLSHLLYEIGGYEALIGLRALLNALAFISVAALLVRPGDDFARRSWALIVLVLVVLVLEGRTTEIRPHLFSYALIPLFLYILEYRRNWLPLLPLLTILWVNVHGVEWPVGAAICGAYFLEAVWRWWKSAPEQRSFDRRLAGWTLACLPATFVNPFGPMILTAPFAMSSEMYLYIEELQPYPLAHLLTVVFSAAGISIGGAVGMLSWGTLLAYLHLLSHGRFRPAPVLLSMVGLLLLIRGERFIWEWVLLSLPLWRMAVNALPDDGERPPHRKIEALNVFAFLVLMSPALVWPIEGKMFHHWPLDARNLPEGVTAFLQREGVQGRLLAPPSLGGHLAWSLYPDILISGDLQGPPSTYWDHFQRFASVFSTRGMQRMLDEFAPNLIAVERTRSDFADRIAQFPAFRPVFVDDQLVLYADKNRLPALARAHALEHVSPYDPLDAVGHDEQQREATLRRLLDYHPRSSVIQHAMVRKLFDEQRYAEALPYAQNFVATVPEEPNAHFMLGNVLENLDRCAEAKTHFEAAFGVADDSSHEQFHRHLASCAYLTKDFASAYAHFHEGLDTYLRAESSEYMFQFAFSAAATGRTEKARILLSQLLYTLPDDETDMRSRAEKLLADL